MQNVWIFPAKNSALIRRNSPHLCGIDFQACLSGVANLLQSQHGLSCVTEKSAERGIQNLLARNYPSTNSFHPRKIQRRLSNQRQKNGSDRGEHFRVA